MLAAGCLLVAGIAILIISGAGKFVGMAAPPFNHSVSTPRISILTAVRSPSAPSGARRRPCCSGDIPGENAISRRSAGAQRETADLSQPPLRSPPTKHVNQTDRAGQPYILHPLRVMAAMDTDEAKRVAILHDVVEDCGVTLDDLRALGKGSSSTGTRRVGGRQAHPVR